MPSPEPGAAAGFPPAPDPTLTRNALRVARTATATGVAIAVASLFGWFFDLPLLVAIHPNVVGMSLVTAICVLVAGVGAWHRQGAAPPGSGRLGAFLGAMVAAIAFLKALDGRVIPEMHGVLGALRGPGDIYPTAMSDYTALALLALGLALGLSSGQDDRREGASQFLAMASLGTTMFVLIGYVYGVQAIVRGTADMPMAFNTAVAVGLVALGVLLGRPAAGPVRILVWRSPGGHLLRALLPAFLVLPFALGGLRLQGERAGLYETWFGVALMTALLGASVIGLTWGSAVALDRKEAERASAEEERRRREEAYRALAEHSPDVVSRFDRDRRRLYINPAIEQYTGIPAAAYIGKTAEELGDASQRTAAWNALLDAVFADGATHAAEFEVVGPDGVRRSFESQAVAERGPGGDVASVLVVSRDITELRRAYDELAAVDRHKDEFLAVASHELRTPLNAVLGYVSFLQEGVGGSLSPEQQAFADQAMAGVERLQALIEDVVEYARIVSGRLPLDQAPTAYEDLVEDLVAGFRPAAAARGLALEVDVRLEGLPCLDGYRIAQALRKLLDNALKFTPEGGRVTVRARRWKGFLLTEIADTGIGIDEEARLRIFAPFRQADMSTTRAAGGLGLGLPICQGIVEAHGGTMGVHSRPTAGSTFWVALPAFGEAAPGAAPDDLPGSSASNTTRRTG